jgi:ABC-type multidrug transport system fused ATPase/permease subunit
MDEATASIDEKTDETIQTMIREQFKDTTVITIAHRLNTIIFYDKILVLDNGEAKEYDTPLNLVENPNTFLGKLIRKTGKAFEEKIIAMAKKGLKE